jgi:hypothetical protein
LFPNSNV